MTTRSASTGPGDARRTRRRIALAATAATLLALAAATATLMTTQTGVDGLVRLLAARSGGALAIEGASGTLAGTVRADRIEWRGDAARVVAKDVALAWRPSALLSTGIVVSALGAREIELDVEPSSAATPLPASLALPVDVTIERIGAGAVAWRVGTNRGRVEGVEFAYAGDANAHRISTLSLATAAGRLTGEASLAANAPYRVDARFAVTGDTAAGDARADVVARGTLEALDAKLDGRAGDGRFAAQSSLAPLAAVPLVALTIDARDLDLAAWNRALPATRLAATARAQPVDGGLAGSLEATNALTGPLDAGRTPVRGLAARFRWRADALELDDLAVAIAGDGRATGRARIPLGDDRSAGVWTLAVRDLDARQLHSSLAATRLAGTIEAALGAHERTVRGHLADGAIAGGVALDFDAAFDERRIELRRLSARAGKGTLEARGTLSRDGERAFAVEASASQVDPSRFGAYPSGSLDGRASLSGVAGGAWRVDANVALARGSTLLGTPISGTARGILSPERARDVAVELASRSATLHAIGSAGAPGDHLTATLAAPQIAELSAFVPAAVPRPLAGALDVSAEIAGAPATAAIAVVAKGSRLAAGNVALGTIDARLDAPAADGRTGVASRRVRLDVAATDVKTPSGNLVRASATLDGTPAAHAIAIAIDGGDAALDATAHGKLHGDPLRDPRSALAWSGALDSLAGTGQAALRLASPATLAFARGQLRVGEARLTVADGRVDVGEFTWDEGRVTSRGRFSAVPIATVARLAGRPLPVPSTLTLGGEWSLAASPRLNGTIAVRRESGDLWLVRNGSAADPGLAAGITVLEATAEAREDALDAKATLRTSRGGSADATIAIGVPPAASPGRVHFDGPLALALVAEVASLDLLQPWAGTSLAIGGRARLDLAAHGTLREPRVSGTLAGTELTVDAPQYGLRFVDGRLAAHVEPRRIVLDELAFRGGEGAFRASGTLAVARDADDARDAAARVAWHAERFRVLNRPDFNLVVSGDGELALAERRLSLTGSFKADEGRFVHDFDAGTALGDDVVVKGWPRRDGATPGAADVPLAIDVRLDFGERLTFAGRGLDTGLRGALRVRSGPGGLAGSGTIAAVNGTYYAYGQKLVIDPGRLVFDGPLDNPGLDIVALRKNLAVEAGVKVTGTVKVPIVALTSNPPVPDNEKLAWLVTGHSLDRGSSADLAALQAASAALLGPNAKPVTTRIAQSVGLDDISIKSGTGVPRGAAAGTPTTSGQVVAIGKRFGDNLSIAWEQGLTVATNALRVEYALTSTLSVRAEAGTVSGVGVYYRRSFD